MPKKISALRSKTDAIYIKNAQNKLGKTKYKVKKVKYGYLIVKK